MKIEKNITQVFRDMNSIQGKALKEIIVSRCSITDTELEKCINGRFLPNENDRKKINALTGYNVKYGQKIK